VLAFGNAAPSTNKPPACVQNAVNKATKDPKSPYLTKRNIYVASLNKVFLSQARPQSRVQSMTISEPQIAAVLFLFAIDDGIALTSTVATTLTAALISECHLLQYSDFTLAPTHECTASVFGTRSITRQSS
jgi:hypothetical protein